VCYTLLANVDGCTEVERENVFFSNCTTKCKQSVAPECFKNVILFFTHVSSRVYVCVCLAGPCWLAGPWSTYIGDGSVHHSTHYDFDRNCLGNNKLHRIISCFYFMLIVNCDTALGTMKLAIRQSSTFRRAKQLQTRKPS